LFCAGKEVPEETVGSERKFTSRDPNIFNWRSDILHVWLYSQHVQSMKHLAVPPPVWNDDHESVYFSLRRNTTRGCPK